MSKKKQKSIEELLEEALVPEEEQPYKVPENWAYFYFTSILDIQGGTQPPKSQFINEPKEDYIRLVQIRDFASDDYLTYIPYTSKLRLIEEEDILIARYGASIGRILTGLSGAYNVALAKVVYPKEHIYRKYLYWLLQTEHFQGPLKMISRSAQAGFNKNDLSNIKLPLPPYNEQRRIAEKIERLFAKIDEAKRLIEEVKGSFELRWESILDKAFRGELTKKWRSKSSIIKSADDIFKEIQNVYKKKNKRDEYEINPPFPIPQNWRWVRLGDIVDINPARKKLEDIEDIQSCSFIPMPSVNDKTGEIENPEIRKYAEVKKGYTFFLENDILFAKITPCMENGKTAIAHNLINGFGFGSTEFHVIRTNPYINTKLIYYLLRSKKFRMEAKKEMTGAVGQQRVPKSFLENYLFPLPPKAEQDKIVELLDHLHVKEVEISKIEALEGEIDSLRQSILNKAFRGELGTNDLTDKHAIELLKEVLKSK